MAATNNARFAQIVTEAFAALGVTQAEFQERGGPSDTTLRKIMSAEPVGVSIRTLSGLDKAFGWKPGTAAAALAGQVRDPRSRARARHMQEMEFLKLSALIESRPESERTQDERDWLARTRDQRNRVVHKLRGEPDMDDHLLTMVELSFLADDADEAADRIAISDLSSLDPDEIEAYIDEVQDLVRAVERLTGAVDEAAEDAAGDATQLRRIKLQVRNARKNGPDIFEALAENPPPPSPDEAESADARFREFLVSADPGDVEQHEDGTQ